MPDFQMPDMSAISSALSSTPIEVPQSDKGRFFTFSWWPAHHQEVEKPVLKAIENMDDPVFDRRVGILVAAQKVDAANGGQLENMGFTATEITRYVTRNMNKRLKQIAGNGDSCYVIRNQKLTTLAIEHKPEA